MNIKFNKSNQLWGEIWSCGYWVHRFNNDLNIVHIYFVDKIYTIKISDFLNSHPDYRHKLFE